MPGALVKLLQDLVGSWLINLWVLPTTTTSPQVSIVFELRPKETKTKLIFSRAFKPFLRFCSTTIMHMSATWLLQWVIPK